jgi:ribonuclease T1
MQSAKRLFGSIIVLAVLLGLAWISIQAEDPGRAPGDSAARPTSTQRVPASATAARDWPTAQAARRTPTPALSADGLETVAIERLPAEARETIALIDQGGPFPYQKDGATFGNRERLLPRQPGGYYREYTVITPGSDDRGARRIVAGDGGELYYTDDHYASFRRVVR